VTTSDERRTQSSEEAQRPSGTNRRGWIWVVQTGVLLGLTLSTCWLLAYLAFGSTEAAMSYLSGDRILAESRLGSFGEVDSGAVPTVDFRLKNRDRSPVEILGVNVSCTCLVVTPRYLRLAEGATGELSVRVRTGKRYGDLAETVRCYTTSSSSPWVDLRVTGRVRPPTSR
jgi:hypothetical protein